jgi:class 3 adenylate cyclase/tetratricopeptide (TPR) repeat protein
MSPTVSEHLAPYSPRALRAWRGDLPGYVTKEGTLVFADVSGFTRLTERLAKSGKAGAETMVGIISRVWEALLADDDGGDVLKFAGDALALFYDGPDHAQRACARALAMQRALKSVGRIETDSFVVRLRMSIGVNSGIFHFFAVGDDHLDLVVPGPETSRTLEMESVASADQVVISTSTAGLLSDARLDGSVGDGRVLRAVPPGPIVPTSETVAVDPARFIPPPLRPLLGTLSHEHRWASVGFVHVGGLDRLLADEGPDAVFDRLQDFTTRAMEALTDRDVLLMSCDLVRDGVGLMLAAGVPQARGEEAAAMLEAVRCLVSEEAELPIRAGVNAGNVFVGDVGPPLRRAFVAMGDTTNLAARVTSKAAWGSVVATSAVLEQTAERFAVRPLEPFLVKGKRRPVEAAVVEARQPQVSEVPIDGPFVGRTAELARLEACLAVAESGRGQVVEIVGDEGTGKSRLVAELRRRRGETTWLRVVCDPFERTSPYGTARRFLRLLLGIDEDATPEEAGRRLTTIARESLPGVLLWLPLIADAVDAVVEDTADAKEVAVRYRRERTRQAAADLVQAAARRPTVIAIEDTSVMDDASAELIAALLTRVEDLPWLVVITRTADTTGLHRGRGYDATLLHLDPLSADDATELALRLAESTPVPRHLIPEMVERAGGNPLFLRELISAADTDMPQTIEGIVAARIDALAPADRQALRFLSVLGERFDAKLVDAALSDLGVEVDDQSLWQRLAAFVLIEERQITFTNPLLRQVAYEGLTFDWRRRIHSRVADALAGTAIDKRPIHLVKAERWEEAWREATAAADRARSTGANAVAAELYDLALEAARHCQPPNEDLWRVAAEASACWARVGIPERALEDLAVAIANAPTENDRLILAAQRAETHAEAGRFSQALSLYTRAMTEAERLPEPHRSRLLGILHAGQASVRQSQGKLDEAVHHARIALEFSEAAGDEPTLAHVHHLLDRLHTARGERKEALRHRDAALPLYAALGDLPAQGTVLHDLAADAHANGRLEEAAWLFDRAVDARTRAGDVVRAAASINALGEVQLAMRRVDEAESRFSEALRTWRGARSPEGIAVASANLANVYLARDDPASALGRLEEAERRAVEIGADHLLPVILVRQAQAFIRLQRWVEAWDAATRALTHPSDVELLATAHELRAMALAATGSEERAQRELSESRSLLGA